MFRGQIGFLTGSIHGLLTDAQSLRPTHLFTVPRVLTKIYNAAMERSTHYPLLGKLIKRSITQRLSQQKRCVYRIVTILIIPLILLHINNSLDRINTNRLVILDRSIV